MKFRQFSLVVSAFVLAVSSTLAHAFPTKPIKLMVPFSPGGGTDILARQLADHLSKQENWNVVVENRPGGMGAVALGSIKDAAPDGHSVILAVRENMVIGPLLREGGGAFDSTKDFTAIASIADTPQVIVTAGGSDFKDMKQVIDYARANPQSLRIGSSGPGSVAHLLTATLGLVADVELTHVPYQGASPAMTDVVGGHIELVGASIASGKAFIESERVRALAVSSPERNPSLPDITTIAELGYPGFDVGSWYAVFGPKGVPANVVQTLNEAINKVVSTPEFNKLLEDQGMVATPGKPEELDKKFQADYKNLEQQLKTLKM